MSVVATRTPLDLATLEHLYAQGAAPQDVLAGVLSRLAAHPDPAVWIHLLPSEEILLRARAVEQERRAGRALPLYGVPFAVKDNIDVAGQPTTAGCPAFRYVPRQTAPVVSCLVEAGAILVGKTNLDQFATGLAGDRSPHGACRNVFDASYISGGSSSGSAVAVAAGLVSFALGTDTAGSGRVPAGCSNIVGLKPAVGLLDTTGVVPACRSLDCMSIFALTADDALRICEAARGALAPHARAAPTATGVTFALPRGPDLEFYGDELQRDLFHRAVGGLEALGWRRQEVPLTPFREVASLLYEGPWVAERLASLRGFLKEHAQEIHPVTRGVLEGAERFSAVDFFAARDRLEDLRPACLAVFERCEVLVVPTMPVLPTIAEVQADSVGWGRRLGHYTNFVNLLGLAAVAVPAGFTARGLPGGITLIGRPGSERRLCELAATWQQRAGLPLGATGHPLPAPPAHLKPASPPPGHVRLAVAGAHLRGQPLHAELRKAGAVFVRACRTAPRYRFVALMDLAPPRPGLVRLDGPGAAIAVEVYDLPLAGFGAVVAAVAPPLAIGTVELEDGEAIKGYLCEGWAAARGRDITDFGGWTAFRDHLAEARPTAASWPHRS
jgi:allophanate hydrolase